MKGTPPDKENNLNIKKINDYNGLNHIKYVSICELTTALKTNKLTAHIWWIPEKELIILKSGNNAKELHIRSSYLPVCTTPQCNLIVTL